MADNNIIIRITSETNLDEAQKQLKALTDQSEEYARELEELKNLEKQDAESIKKLGLSEQQLEKALKKNKEYYRDLRTAKKNDIAESKKSIKTLEQQVKSYNVLNGSIGNATQQLRAMRERLMEMEDAGEFGSQAYIDLSIAAGRLEDQMSDTQQRIRVLASDTKELDAVMGLGDGLAGSFYVATSAAELFGGDMEGLQQAFYKVQAAMSIVSGTQQVLNALNKDSNAMVVLNTALKKLRAKQEVKTAAATSAETAAIGANTAALGAETAATGTATAAQWSLNAAFLANPIGVVVAGILAAVAAFAALGVIIYKIIHSFSEEGKAQERYKEASKELEKVQAENAQGAAKRAFERQQQVKATNDAEEKALSEARKRNASEIELAQIKAKYAKQTAEETKKFTEDEIKRNDKEVAQLKRMMDAKRKEVNAHKDGSKKKKKALEELAEAEQNYYDALQKSKDLENERTEALNAAAEAEQELLETRQQMRLQAEQANIDLMREGAAKEIAQINYNYREQLKTLTGNSEEETKLRKALLAKQAQEIAAVRKKYALQAQQTAIQEQKNLLTLMAQSGGTEADYAEELALTKKIAEQEAQARIDALDKTLMKDEEYKAQKEAIELELQATLRQIDEQEIQRLNENAKRRTEIALAAAEAEKNALSGAEPIEEQKAVWAEYYAFREQQIRENAEMEIAAVNRSTDTVEVKAEKIKLIETQMQADITANAKEQAEQRINIESQYLSELERRVSETEDAVSKAQFGGKLSALENNLNAQLNLYDTQLANLKSQYEAGLISYQDFKQQEFEITKAIADAEAEYQTSKIETITDAFNNALGYMQQISDMAFEALGNNVQAEIDALNEMYTTDWEEAQKSADKKYITEKEYEKKKAALEMKQAKYAKAQALINAAINTALAVTSALTAMPPASFIMAALAAAMGAAQIGIIASKPLAQYEKGRKGGKGEYALVGEKGAEIMYIPQGASIIPHHKIGDMDAWGAYGVPKINIPDLPSTNTDIMQYAAAQTAFAIDYDKLGEAVARNMPQQKAVTVNVDRSGIRVTNGNDTRTYLNKKYNGTWN